LIGGFFIGLYIKVIWSAELSNASPLFQSHQPPIPTTQQQQSSTTTTMPMIMGVFFFFGASGETGISFMISSPYEF
jgi:hypothetical protein